MKRREFIAGFGSAAAWPARAQPSQLPTIGFLRVGVETDVTARDIAAFRQGLANVGYVEGRNVAIDYRSPGDDNSKVPALLADFVRRPVAVIVASGGVLYAHAAKAATKTIPIVFTIGGDPVESGLVASLNRPGGNLTGATMLVTAVVAKHLELLHEMLPGVALFGLITNPNNSVGLANETKELEVAARVLGVRFEVFNAGDPAGIEAAFAAAAERRVGGLVVSSDPDLTAHKEQIVTLAARHLLPATYFWRDYVGIGGLMSYGSRPSDAYRLAGDYVGRILKGEKPADLPVQQASRIELAINLKTAKAMNLTFPTALLLRADEVIE